MVDAANRGRILVVEDEFLIALGLETGLRDEGFDVLSPCGDLRCAEALVAREAEISGAILDYNLGGETAAPVARTLRDRGVPTVFVTGLYDRDILAEFPDATVLRKPVRIDEVVALLVPG